MLHHLGTTATLCLVIFTIFDTGALQPMLLMTQTILAFETLEVGSCHFAAMRNDTAHKALGIWLACSLCWGALCLGALCVA